MTFAEFTLLLGLLVAGALIATGCFLLALPIGFITSGVLVAVITLFMTVEVGE